MWRISISLHLFAVLASAISPTQGVSLADFIPLVTGLPPSCDAAYRAPIKGCQVSDFSAPFVCSQSCLMGLVDTNGAVTTACRSVIVEPDSIIAIFLSGKGISALCNVAVVTTTTGLTSTSTPFATSSTSQVTVSVLSSSSSSTAPSNSATSSSTLKTSASSSGASSSASAIAAKQNPSVPDCSNKSSTGSPFDSFSDQACAKSAASSKRLSPFAAIIGLLFAIVFSQ